MLRHVNNFHHKSQRVLKINLGIFLFNLALPLQNVICALGGALFFKHIFLY